MPQHEKNTDHLIDRLPPKDNDAEVAVLGAMLQENYAVGRAIEILGDSGDWCFYDSDHIKIYNAITAKFSKNEKADVITIADELTKRNQLDEIGGKYYLTELVARVPSAANIEHHARIVFKKARKRRLVVVGAEIVEDAFSDAIDDDDAIERAERNIFSLATNRLKGGFVKVEPVLTEAFAVIDSAHKNRGLTGVPTGFTDLDDKMGGLQKSDLIIVAGRPSTGKTAFALNISRNAAVDHKTGVGFFSLEMARWQLGIRLICSEARIDSHRARNGKLSPSEASKLAVAVSKLNGVPLHIDDSPRLSAMEIVAKARRLVSENKVGLFVVDYLQIMRHANAENRNIAIGESTAILKGLAKDLNIPVVVLSQLSRKVEDRSDGRPQLSDLRESGAIEQDADVVLFPWENAIIIGKQRNGPTGDVPIVFLKEHVMFANSIAGRDNANPGRNYNEHESERETLPF